MTDDHESVCRKCGRCCCEKYIVDRTVVYTDRMCRWLDPETRLCKIYERRHEVNPDCLSFEHALEMQIFPADCPYVKDRPDYVPPIEGGSAEELVRMIEEHGDLVEDDEDDEPPGLERERRCDRFW